MTFRKAFLTMAGLVPFTLPLLLTNSASAQESTSNPATQAAPVNGPSAALRDVLMAACSQSQNDFEHFLTARNKESFTRMAPAARVAFMKRFVLLNQAGKPTATTNPSGRPIVRCDTPEGAAEIQIGGADTSDNVAFLPVNLRDATDTTDASAIQVTMGMVRENSEWKILSLGVVLLDLPSLELEWDSAEADKNEQTAIESLKEIAEAVESLPPQVRTACPTRFLVSGLRCMVAANADAAGLVEADLAAGMRNGYSFRYVIVGASGLGAPGKFELAATPLTYGRTGHRSYFRDACGTLRGADRQGAVGSAGDPRLPEH